MLSLRPLSFSFTISHYVLTLIIFSSTAFGTDRSVLFDFDGDGKTDIAVFRPATGQWFRNQSTSGFDSVNWGQAGDIPAAADYDGDGKADVAVFRPTAGTWFLNQSTAGFLTEAFGQNGDRPTQSAYIY